MKLTHVLRQIIIVVLTKNKLLILKAIKVTTRKQQGWKMREEKQTEESDGEEDGKNGKRGVNFINIL